MRYLDKVCHPITIGSPGTNGFFGIEIQQVKQRGTENGNRKPFSIPHLGTTVCRLFSQAGLA
jgi:hypothetical protein